MTPERFHSIVAAYGADSRHWPDSEREAARAWAGAHPEAAGALLAEAAELDGWLGAHHVAPAGHALVERIVAGAPAARRPWTRGRLWWSGAAVAGVGALGALAGALAMSSALLASAPPSLHESSYLTTSFGGSTDDWSGE